jgi:V/A-type H+-transporting ATPase subunit D
MADTISPNRSELLRLKGKISMAQKGHSLLKKKRDGLVIDFFKLLENAKDLRSEMIKNFRQAKKSLTKTRILTYDLEIKLYSKTTKGRNLVDFQSKNIMGLTVPQIKSEFAKRDLIERQKTIYASYTMDETISKYEDLVKQIIIVAEVETAMIRLLSEIEKTKRRVNGLEFNILPKLSQDEAYVKLTLQEQERDAIIALKKIKSKIEAKKA